MDEPQKPKGYWQENFRRSFKEWEGREVLIGLLILFLTAIGYGVFTQDPNMTRTWSVVAIGYVAFLLLIQSPWQMWRDSQREIIGYRESLRPHISFVFTPDVPPYLHLFCLQQQGFLDRIVRIYRVGIRNDSVAVISRVRVVVESATYMTEGGIEVKPDPSQPVLIEHALNVMGIDTKDGTVDLSPGDRPTAYIDVVEQFTPQGKDPEQWVSLCYATSHRTPMDGHGRWLLTLRVEGAGYYRRARFLIDGSGADKTIRMMPFALD